MLKVQLGGCKQNFETKWKSKIYIKSNPIIWLAQIHGAIGLQPVHRNRYVWSFTRLLGKHLGAFNVGALDAVYKKNLGAINALVSGQNVRVRSFSCEDLELMPDRESPGVFNARYLVGGKLSSD